MIRLQTLLVAALLAGCAGSIGTKHSEREEMELGWTQRGDFMSSRYPKFLEVYDTVQIDPNFVEMIKSLHEGLDFVVILGTWCSDSKKHVPRFLKIADLATIPPSRVRYYGVDRTKRSSDGVTEQYGIERVPTFIVLKNGTEIGRIVEFPKTSLEEDFLVILADGAGR